MTAITPSKASKGPYLIVGMAGRAGAGKDTCAEILSSAHAFARLAFADAVRAELAHAFGVDVRLFTNRSLKEAPTLELALKRCADLRFVDLMMACGIGLTYEKAISPRTAMRLWGTEYRRAHCGGDYWLLRAHERIEALHRAGWRRIAITDVRFLNEAAFVQMMGGEVWRIRRHMADQAPATHQSEMQVESIQPERTLHNDSTISALVYDALVAFRDAVAPCLSEDDHAEAPHP
ncbi:hypothetical protein [Achromobacter pestifer]